jgi:hypothetical protein
LLKKPKEEIERIKKDDIERKEKRKDMEKKRGGGIEEIYILIITNTNNLISTEKYTENKTM